MFDFVRKHTRIMQFLLFLLIFPSFVLFGLDGYNRYSEKGETVAQVDGIEIKQQEWDDAHKAETDRQRAANPKLDTKLLDTPQARYATLEKLLQQRVLTVAAAKKHLVIGDARLASELRENPTIASLRKADGSLDVERYRQLVGAQGMSPEMFEERVRGDLASRQVVAGVMAASIESRSLSGLALQAFLEKRDVQLTRFTPADYAARVKPTTADLETYYQQHTSEFQSPEQADIEYVLLDLDAVRKTITVNEQDLKTYYEQNQSRLAGQEQRRASHILLTVAAQAPDAERQKVKQKAVELQARVAKAPDSFADVARKNSQDPGSAGQGGDLDFFSRGAMVKPFEDTVFAMKKGEISGVVETEFGYHIIRLTDVKTPKTRSFEEMRPDIEAELKKQQAQRKFAEVAETFTNTVYEQSDSLKPVIDKLGLELRTVTSLPRHATPDAKGALANARFLDALFAADATQRKRNTEALEIAPNQLVAGRVVRYAPAVTRPFESVTDAVRVKWVAQQALALAKKEGAAQLEALRQSGSGDPLKEKLQLSRQDSRAVGTALVDAVLRAEPSSLPALMGVDLGHDGFAVVRVIKTLPADVNEATQNALHRQYGQSWSAAEGQAYYEWLKTQLKASINAPKPEAAKTGTPVASVNG